MKMRAPQGCTGITPPSGPLVVDAEGFVDANPDDVAVLRSHGFMDLPEVVAPVPIEAMSRSQMVALVLERGQIMLEAMPDDELRRVVDASNRYADWSAVSGASGAVSGAVSDASDESGVAPVEEPGFNAAEAAPDLIAAMNRNELFAYIRAHGGAGNIAFKNEELRDLARSLTPAP